jgi:hypothetical protein
MLAPRMPTGDPHQPTALRRVYLMIAAYDQLEGVTTPMPISGNVTRLKTLDGHEIILPSDAHGDGIEEYDVSPNQAHSALQLLHFQAFDDIAEATERAQAVSASIANRLTVGAVLRNRVYRDRLDCPDPA